MPEPNTKRQYSSLGSFRPTVGNRYLPRYYKFTRPPVKTALKS